MKSTTAIRIADQVLQNSDLFTKKDEQQELEDVKKNDPLSSQIWRMYTKAKDNLPNGSRLENLTWRMMALSLKKDQGPSSEQLDLKHANPEPEVASKSPPMIQDAHVIIDYTDENQQLFFLENTEPPLSIMNNYSMSTNTAEFTSLQDIFDMPYTDDNVMMYNQPITQQNMSSTDQQRRQSSIKSTSSDEKEKRKNQNPKNGLTKCKNCSTKNTPLWRRDPSGNPLCNACGLFLKLHGVVRPLSLKTDVIKKRNRSNNPPSKSLPTNNNITTTPSKSINKRRRYSTKQKNDQLLGTSLPIMPSSPSSFYFSPASLTPPPALGHSSSISSLVSLNPSPPQQQQDNSIYSIFDEMGIYLPTPADNNMANTTDDLLYSNNSYFY